MIFIVGSSLPPVAAWQDLLADREVRLRLSALMLLSNVGKGVREKTQCVTLSQDCCISLASLWPGSHLLRICTRSGELAVLNKYSELRRSRGGPSAHSQEVLPKVWAGVRESSKELVLSRGSLPPLGLRRSCYSRMTHAAGGPVAVGGGVQSLLTCSWVGETSNLLPIASTLTVFFGKGRGCPVGMACLKA